jgi:Cft2 family RNA processing exonuclease
MRGEVVYVNGRMNRVTASLARYSPDWLINKVLKRFAKRFRRV